MKFLFLTALGVRNAFRRLRYKGIYSLFKNYTMVPQDYYETNLALAEKVKKIKGCVIECGVWRGGMIAGVARLLGPSRKYFLFDSFEGLPPAKEIDGPAALDWQRKKNSPFFHNNCTAESHYAEQAMKKAGITNSFLIQGWFSETLPKFEPPEPIAFLRLDGDWYESTKTCLEALFQKVTPGGLVVIDDYYTWDGCSKATHDYLSKISALERIESKNGVCFLIKKAQNEN